MPPDSAPVRPTVAGCVGKSLYKFSMQKLSNEERLPQAMHKSRYTATSGNKWAAVRFTHMDKNTSVVAGTNVS